MPVWRSGDLCAAWHRQVEPGGRHRTRKPSPAASVAPRVEATRVPVSSAEEQSSREGVIDVLVPTRNRPTELATTLAGLAAQDHPFDVLVSDQSDGQASFETPPATALLRVLAGHGRRIRTTRHLPRRGLAEHRAAMLAASSAPFALFCDDDVWLEPGVVGRLHEAIVELRCGLVGAAVQGLSYLHDHRLTELEPFERWPGRPEPELIEPGRPAWQRWTLHNAANPAHLARRHLRPDERWLAYKIAAAGVRDRPDQAGACHRPPVVAVGVPPGGRPQLIALRAVGEQAVLHPAAADQGVRGGDERSDLVQLGQLRGGTIPARQVAPQLRCCVQCDSLFCAVRGCGSSVVVEAGVMGATIRGPHRLGFGLAASDSAVALPSPG